MKQTCRTTLDRLLYGPVERSFYRDNALLLDRCNYSVLRVSCAAVAAVELILLAFYCIDFTDSDAFRAHIYYTAASLLLCAAVWIFVRKKITLTGLFYYVLYALSFSQTLLFSTVFSPYSRMVSVFLVIIMMPVLYVQTPLYSHLALLTTCAAAFAADAAVKGGNRTLLLTDTASILTCYLLAAPFLALIREKDLVNISSRKFFQIKAQTDGLTGLQNRWSCEMQIRAYLNGTEEPCALIIADIDSFKSVNDAQGHFAGDSVLRELGRILLSDFRQTDIVSRLGGDEFLILMKLTASRDLVAEKCRRILSDIATLCLADGAVPFTCSLGAVLSRGRERSFESLYQAADEALYEAKRTGKGRFVLR